MDSLPVELLCIIFCRIDPKTVAVYKLLNSRIYAVLSSCGFARMNLESQPQCPLQKQVHSRLWFRWPDSYQIAFADLKMSSISFLRMRNRNLKGKLPPSISLCRHLISLDLRGNSLSGCIPEAIGQLFCLKSLDLSLNKFNGSIPELGTLSYLIYCNLSCNRFEGCIPRSIEGLKSLVELDLSDNQLEGGIPPEIGSLHSLHILRAERNFLSGSLPEEIAKLRDLRILALRKNRLNKYIPTSVSSGTKLWNLIRCNITTM